MAEREITFEIVKAIGVLSRNDRGWSKELNLVSWNGQAPKYDIRDWDQEHERMSRGITLTKSEMQNMMELYQKETDTIRE
ncbi:MAG: PC4/YdbC family ssDNA-binding protein [Eubacterium sp.]|nr:PC4/YdbC family ssDNA-binding protein [Eubacterium sp.]